MQSQGRKTRHSLFIAAAALALTGLGIGWLALTRSSNSPAVLIRSSAPATAAPSGSTLDRAPGGATGATAPTDTPPGVTAAQWQALQAQLLNQPHGPAELARIADYLRWSDLVQRLRVPIADSAERLQLARAIEAGLDARLRAGEVSAGEARQIKAAVLEVTQPDQAARTAELQRWSAALATPAQTDPRQAEFDRRQAAAVAAWSAQATGTRDRAALERELEALRREVFGAPAGRADPLAPHPSKEPTR